MSGLEGFCDSETAVYVGHCNAYVYMYGCEVVTACLNKRYALIVLDVHAALILHSFKCFRVFVHAAMVVVCVRVILYLMFTRPVNSSVKKLQVCVYILW